MPSRRPETRLAPFARLPRRYHDGHIAHSTVDAYGRAHWLLTERDPRGRRSGPYDATVLTVGDGSVAETRLHAVLAGFPALEPLPDGGFVVADQRSRANEDHVQLFDAFGRCGARFRVGDAVEHLQADEAGDLWVGYFDEGIYGDDPLSWPGLRCWSPTGEALWSFEPAPGVRDISDCYALNVHGRTAWAYPYTDFPLLEIHRERGVRVRRTGVHGAKGLAVHGDRLVLFGGYQEEHDRIVDCRLTDETAEPVTEGRLVLPDGSTIGRRRVVSRGPRLYVQGETGLGWSVLDIS